MPEFTDAQLVVILSKAVRRVNRKLCLKDTDRELSIDATTGEITPDDECLKDIVLLQAECLITQRHFVDFLSPDSTAAGLLVEDGEQKIDTRAAGTSRAGVFSSNNPLSPCAELAEAIKAEKLKIMMDGEAGSLIW